MASPGTIYRFARRELRPTDKLLLSTGLAHTLPNSAKYPQLIQLFYTIIITCKMVLSTKADLAYLFGGAEIGGLVDPTKHIARVVLQGSWGLKVDRY